ncbi:MAG: hypothetical protein RJA70_1905 [Pseudomonadota bacterium]
MSELGLVHCSPEIVSSARAVSALVLWLHSQLTGPPSGFILPMDLRTMDLDERRRQRQAC